MEKRQIRTLAELPGVAESFNSCTCLSKNKNNYSHDICIFNIRNRQLRTWIKYCEWIDVVYPGSIIIIIIKLTDLLPPTWMWRLQVQTCLKRMRHGVLRTWVVLKDSLKMLARDPNNFMFLLFSISILVSYLPTASLFIFKDLNNNYH